MASPELSLTDVAELISRAQSIVDHGLDRLAANGGIDANQTFAYDLSHAASAIATARANLDYAAKGSLEATLTGAFLAQALSDLAGRILGREELWGVSADWFLPFSSFVATYRTPNTCTAPTATYLNP